MERGQMRLIRILAGLFLTALVATPRPVTLAQPEAPEGAVYIVEEGDSLWEIAARFGVTLEALQAANDLRDPGQLSSGARLVIPGLEGYQGFVDTIPVGYGENLRSLSRRYRVPRAALVRLNRLSSPEELYAGASLVIPVEAADLESGSRALIRAGQTLLERAVWEGVNPWALVQANQLPGAWGALPGDVLINPASAGDGPGALPGAIGAVTLTPLPLVQGGTALVEVAADNGIHIEGQLADYRLHFFPNETGWVALQGVHALFEPGFYSLDLSLDLPGSASEVGEQYGYSQRVYIRSGDYPFDPPLTVAPETIDPDITEPENEKWEALVAEATPEKLWESQFQSPVPDEFTNCYPSLFGNRRSFNGSPYEYYHSGLDFCGGVGTEIHAPAAGEVVFAGPLVVRGDATVINHGWGVYTAYAHQSEIFVETGQEITPGQLIGLGGATGRVTGPHLHWEVWVGGVAVDPLDWLEQAIP